MSPIAIDTEYMGHCMALGLTAERVSNTQTRGILFPTNSKSPLGPAAVKQAAVCMACKCRASFLVKISISVRKKTGSCACFEHTQDRRTSEYLVCVTVVCVTVVCVTVVCVTVVCVTVVCVTVVCVTEQRREETENKAKHKTAQ